MVDFSDTIPHPLFVDNAYGSSKATSDLPGGILKPELFARFDSSDAAGLRCSQPRPVLFAVAPDTREHQAPYYVIRGTTLSITIAEEIRVTLDPRLFASDGNIYRAGEIVSAIQYFCSGLRCDNRSINVSDTGSPFALSFCAPESSKGGLIPDLDFIVWLGYAELRRDIDALFLPWAARRSTALWRGAAIATYPYPEERVLKLAEVYERSQRLRLCSMATSVPGIDAHTTGQTIDPRYMLPPLRRFAGASIEPAHFKTAKYAVDVDGFSNSWKGLFTKLYCGNVVLKVASPERFVQWYYHRLVPWTNYVPVSQDLSDLPDIISWLRECDDEAERIGEAGRALASSLTFKDAMIFFIDQIRGAPSPD